MKIRLQIILLLLPFYSIAQLFVNNTTFTPAQLVQNTLLGNGVTVSNITFNGSAANANAASDQVGFFSTGINPTNLGIDSGIILTTGRGNVAVGPNNANNASNPPASPIAGDADLALLATGGINNKAVLEFDFIPTGNQLNFNFVFASEEYPEFVNSAFNDVFGFFLSGPGIAGPYSGGAANIALVPSTTTAITINNLNGGFAAGCPLVLPGGANSAFYVNNCGGTSIQYDGFTTVLTATATVQCGQLYHIKLAVANVSDNAYDSAVFLQANSFNVNPIDLGNDFLETAGNALCIGQTAELNSGLDASVPHQWYLDTVIIPGATGNTYTVTEPGIYTVIATPFGAGCPIQDSIEIEYYPPLPVAEPIDLFNCPGDSIYDLTENTSVVLGSLDPSVFILDYATSIFNGENGIFIANPTAYVSSGSGEIVYVVVVDTGSGNDCTSIQPFQLLQQSCTLDPQPFPITVCDDISNDGIEVFDLTLADSAALNGLDPALYTVTYHLSQADANSGSNDISPSNAFSTASTIIYVRVEDNSNPTTFGSTSFSITINPTPIVAVNNFTICDGQTATITATPNVAGTYDYSWSVPATIANPGNVATFTTTVAGVYSVIITDTTTNCVSPSASGTVTVNPNPTVTVNSPAVCAGASATVTATPGVAGTYSYAWTVPTGATAPGDVATFNTTIAGVYSVIITDTVTGCVSTSASGTVTINPNPTVTVNSPTVCDGASATVTATPGVAGAYSYAWTVPAAATPPGDVATFTTTIAGVYSVIITDTVTGCVSTSVSGTVSLSTNPTVTVNSPTVCEGTPATVTATPGAAGTYSYAWTVPAGVTNPGNVATFTTTVAGVYSVIITDTTTNCVSPSASGTVTVNPNPTVTVNSPAVCAGASATVTATPGVAGTYSYAWTVPTGATAPGDVATFTTTIAGVYSVIITNTLTNCVSTSASGTVTINPNPTVTVNSPTVCDGASATVTATPGVAGAYSYAWTVPATATPPGDVATFTTTIAGVYSVIITNTVTGCVSTSASGTVSLSTNPTVTVNSPTVCEGTPATVTATPGAAGTYSYAWTVPTGVTNPGNVATFTTTVAGVYSVIITDTTTNCVSPSASGTVTVNPNPTVTVNSPAVCAGASATVTATPGVAGTYSYAWTVPTGATAPGDVATFNTTVAGVYSVIITNTLTNCVSTSASGTVTINPNPTVTVNSPAVCAGASATVTATPGVAGAYSYAWTVPTGAANPGNVATFTTTIAGVYSVIITNTATGCISTSASGTVTINPNPTVSVNSATVCEGTIVTMTATPGTAGTYNYAWTVPTGVSNPGNVASFTTTTAGTYSVVITNTVTNCVSVSASGTITLLPLPTATIAGNITICPTAEATVTFTGTPNTTVEYSVNGSGIQTLLLDAAGVGVIVDTYNTTTTYTLLGVFTSGTPVCSVSLNESITITVAPAPTINTPADLILCDDNNDGVQTFNLDQYTTFITGGNPNVTLTYHETLVDAQLGGAPIPNPSNYQSIVPGAPSVQTIYVRVVNTGTTDCPSITTFNLFVNPFPVINLTPTAYELCDDNTDGEQVFDLTTRISNILNGLDSSLHTVTFHQTDLEAQAGTPIITGANAYLSPTQTIWVRVEINATGCFAIAPLDLIVNPLPQANLPTPLTLCDNNNPGDQLEEFDLTQAISEIVGSQVGMQVTFHLTLAQAQAGTNVLNTTYTNVTPAVQTLHVRVLNPVTGCWSTTTLDIRVVPLPLPLVPLNPITLCDDNNDGLASFDLQAQVPGLLNGATDVDLTFHETEQQAIDGTNVIDISTPYLTINAGTQFIYVRAVNTITGCVRVVVIELQVNPRPQVPTLDDLTQCDTDNNPLNGLSQFNLTVQTPIILAAQVEAANQYSVRYFTTEANAISNTGAIVNTNAFPNTVNPQTIWVRVTHIATGCFDVGSFALIVDTPLALTVPTPISLCDEALPNNQFTVFDLTVRNNDITNNLGGYTVTYYPSYQNALDNVNAIQNPSAYTNATAAVQTLGVRVTSAAGCHSYTTLTIRVIPLPEPRTNPEPIEACDDNNPGDGIEAFDLTQRAIYILNGASSTEFSLAYYVSEADAIAETNAIVDPTAFNNTIAVTQTIWVRVTREPNNVNEPRCYQLVELQLIVNSLPVIAASPINFYQCEPIDDYQMPFVLSTMNPQVLGDTQLPSDYTVSYYLSAADAVSGTSPLPNVYTNISSPQTIYVRVENNQTGCVNATGEVILTVEEGTQANTIAPSDPLITQCDQTGANDGIGQFDLTGLTPILLGSNNPTGAVVYYFTTLAQAQAAIQSNDYTTAIANAATYQNVTPEVETMYAVLVNPATVSNCPTLVPIVLTVNRLPEPTPVQGTLCIDPQTGELLNTYTLTSNLSATTHTFEWTDSTGTILGTAPDLTVDTPGTYTVVATNIATQCVSLPVATLVVQSQQATLSYVQSNYFSDSATITITATGTSIPDQGNSNYVYSLDYGPFQASNVFTNVSAGLHIVTVQDLNGCSDATIEVFVVDYPKFFTPNGDGINDTWNIFSLGETQPNAKIYIFDRYGKFIKQISPAGDGWNGTYNGEQLPSTDYWFNVEYEENGQNKVFKAHFSLKR